MEDCSAEPDDTEDYLGILSVQDKAVITSGDTKDILNKMV